MSESGQDRYNPTIGRFAVCCARAPSGHAAAAPPSSVMKSRRLVCRAEQSEKRLLRFFHPRACRGALAHNKENRVLVLGAIPVHLLAEMGDEGTCWHRYGIGRVKFIAGTDPPRALEHGDEAVVGMKMRATEVITCEPFVDHDIKAGLFRVADKHRVAVTTGTLPLDLIRQFVDDRCWI